LEILYEEIEKNSKNLSLDSKLKENLLKHKEQSFFSKFLAKIKRDVPMGFNLDECRWGNYDEKQIIQIFKKYQFFSLIKRLSEFKEKTKSKKEIQRSLF